MDEYKQALQRLCDAVNRNRHALTEHGESDWRAAYHAAKALLARPEPAAADAAFAALKQQHAEEIERLRKQLQAMHRRAQKAEARAEWLDTELISSQASRNLWLRSFQNASKQAGRYEKLRKLNVGQFQELFIANIAGKGRFDELVDQLPASGEQKP